MPLYTITDNNLTDKRELTHTAFANAANFAHANDGVLLDAALSDRQLYIPYLMVNFAVGGGSAEILIDKAGTGNPSRIEIPTIEAASYIFAGPFVVNSPGSITIATAENVGIKYFTIPYTSYVLMGEKWWFPTTLKNGLMLVDGMAEVEAAVVAMAALIAPKATHDDPVVADGIHPILEAKDFDGAALPNSVAEGDGVRSAGSLHGVSYIMPVTQNGAATPLVVEGVAAPASPALLSQGSKYNATEPTAADGQWIGFQSTSRGHLKVNDSYPTSIIKILDLTDTAAATVRTLFSLSDCRYYSLHVRVSGGVTMTHFLTLDSGATDAADTGWIQDTVFGTLIDDELLFERDTEVRVLNGMLKYVTSDNTNRIEAWLSKFN